MYKKTKQLMIDLINNKSTLSASVKASQSLCNSSKVNSKEKQTMHKINENLHKAKQLVDESYALLIPLLNDEE